MTESFLNGRVTLRCGDNREVLRTIATCSIDSIVTDPPYALVSIVKRFANSPRSERTENTENPYGRTGRGFMGHRWDTGEVAFDPEFWAECLRVLKPGGHIVAFSGTRTYHRMTVAIEDAGFEIRDQIGWTYGSGFPKSHNIGDGWGTALKPAWEPIALGRKPIVGTVAGNVARFGTGAINVDGCRVPSDEVAEIGSPSWGGPMKRLSASPGQEGKLVERTPPNNNGRWPANIVHDGSDEVVEAFPTVGDAHAPANEGSVRVNQIYGSDHAPRSFHAGFSDSGSAARFFYTAKADADDRLGSKHPTVKPVDLMQWLVRLVTPKGGIVMDPFAGTGTTAEAAFREGMNCVLIERESEYQADIRRRMALVMAGPDERSRESVKAKTKDKPVDAGPLFGGVS